MKKELPVRKHIRLEGYDYSKSGYYFITMCVKGGHEILWDCPFVGARIARPPLSAQGDIVRAAIEHIPQVYSSVEIDNYVVMPNHVHMLVVLHKVGGRAMRAPTISRIVNQMKGYVTKQLGYPIWQKLFHDHVIRSEEEYQKIWTYIENNPATWTEDCYHKNK